MSDEILKQVEIAAYLGKCLSEINSIKRYLLRKQKEEENDPFEAPQDASRLLSPYVFFSCQVSSVVDSSSVWGLQTIPGTSSTTPWIVNPTFADSAIPLTVPANVSAPSVGDQVLAHFTGLYTNASSELTPRYGIFGAGGGASIQQTEVQSIGDDHLVVRTLTGTVVGGTDILVAKNYMNRRTPFDGETVNDYTYTYSTAVDRVVTIAASTAFKEIQTIIPRYNVGDVVYVQEVNSTLFNVTVSGTPQAVTLIDLNNDNREFVRVGFSS